MSQLLSGKNKGRFGAPPEESARRSPWAYVPIIVLMPITIILVVITLVTWTTYYNCGDTTNFGSSVCVGSGVKPIETGTMGGLVGFTGLLLALAFILSIVAAVKLKTWPVWIAWSIAAVACAFAIYALLALQGSIPTPFGGLGSLPD
jgi:hypothetical protein